MINCMNVVIERMNTTLQEGLSGNDHSMLWTIPMTELQVVILRWMKLDKLHNIFAPYQNLPNKTSMGQHVVK